MVKANESRLANKLFDPCRVTGGDNGMTLPYQYRSALDTLTPKLNEKIAKAKNQLRELLLTHILMISVTKIRKAIRFRRYFIAYMMTMWLQKEHGLKNKTRKKKL